MDFTIIVKQQFIPPKKILNIDSDYFFLKDIIAFPTQSDLQKFIRSKGKIVFETSYSIDFPSDEEKYYDLILEEIKRERSFVVGLKTIEPVVTFDKESEIAHIRFEFTAEEIEQYYSIGVFRFNKFDSYKNAKAFIDDEEKVRISYQDSENKPYPLSIVKLKDIELKGHIYNVRKFDPKFSNTVLVSDNKYMYHPPGALSCISWEGHALKQAQYQLEFKNFRPDEYVAVVKRDIIAKDQCRYTLMHPNQVIDILSKNNNQITVLNVNKQLERPIGRVSLGTETRFFNYSRYDHLLLPLPTLFMGHPDFQITEHHTRYTTLKSEKFSYFSNPIQYFDIYSGKQASSKSMRYLQKKNKELPPEKKLSYDDMKIQSETTNIFIEKVETIPDLMAHHYSTDVLQNGHFHRYVNKDEHFIYLKWNGGNKPSQDIRLVDLLPDYLETKCLQNHCMIIQYNASESVPVVLSNANAKAGRIYNSQSGNTIVPGYIYRNIDADELKELNVAPNYGGTYFTLSICSKEYVDGDYRADAPELYTVFVTGKDWNSLVDYQGKQVKYPYIINY